MTKAMPVHGVDISHHQSGRLDLAGAKKRGLRWLYHKATEGDGFVDSRYEQRRRECHAIGLPFGAYHFARPERGDARAEAEHFLSVAKPVVGNLRPALDLEVHDGMTMSQLRSWAKDWIEVVTGAIGVRPVVYTPYDLGDASEGCIIWRPRYNNDNRPPLLSWDIWQFSNGVYGVPSKLEGVGAVDLNTMREGLKVRDMLIPRREPLPEYRLHVAHVSMQNSDPAWQVEHDAERVFTRAKRRGISWVTGTEAGQAPVRPAIRKFAEENGFYLLVARDVWIAIREEHVVGPISSSFQTVVPNGVGWGHHHDLGLLAASWKHKEIGKVSAGVSHFLTRGARPGDTNYRLNGEIIDAVNKWGRQAGAGAALAFFSGDTNISDKTEDVFRGGPFTTVGDELDTHPGTGHGPIDVIASYNRDGRVKADYLRVLRDNRFPLFTDHFMVEAGFRVNRRRR